MRYRPAVRLAIAVLIGAILPTPTTAQTRPLPPPTRTPTPQTYAALADEVERRGRVVIQGTRGLKVELKRLRRVFGTFVRSRLAPR